MINDRYIRWFFIPLLGLAIPFISGFYQFQYFDAAELLTAVSYSVFISFCVWQGCSRIIYRYRNVFAHKPFTKISALCLSAMLYSSVIATFFCLIWMLVTTSHIEWKILLQNTIIVSIAAVLFTLVYEILYLSHEKETEETKTKQLDTALSKAQLTILKNELDPHFMYNALNTLSWLVKADTEKADDFIIRLAEIYKYFLKNKNKEYVTLQEELQFIDQYFFLLQLRYDNKIKLEKEVWSHDLNSITILPCALQILVENAIKHNAFSDSNPLNIKISINEENIYVVNTKSPAKIPPHYSTKIGLSNLKARYELVCKKAITIESNRKYFVVRLPLLKSA